MDIRKGLNSDAQCLVYLPSVRHRLFGYSQVYKERGLGCLVSSRGISRHLTAVNNTSRELLESIERLLAEIRQQAPQTMLRYLSCARKNLTEAVASARAAR